MIGMNEDEMNKYIEFVADFWLKRLGYSTIYESSNPFPWMELQGNENKSNFFENRVTEYAKAGILVEEEDNQFTMEADF